MEDAKEHLRNQFAIVAENQLADDIMFYFYEERGEVTVDEFIKMFKEEVNKCIERYVRSLEANMEEDN